MENTINSWVVEHSNKQNCYHIDLFINTIKNNLKNIYEPYDSDYQIIFMGTYDECKQFIEKIKEWRKE